MSFIYVEIGSLSSWFAENLTMKEFEFCHLFSAFIDMIILLILVFVNVVYHIIQFTHVELSLHAWNK